MALGAGPRVAVDGEATIFFLPTFLIRAVRLSLGRQNHCQAVPR